MILTCPNCGTQYVVKDGAIPPEGRQVRCAACKHSWHQNPEDGSAVEAAEPPAAEPPAAGPDEPLAVRSETDQADSEESLAEATLIEPRSGPEAEERAYEAVLAETQTSDEVQPEREAPAPVVPQGVSGEERAPTPEADWREPPTAEDATDMFSPFAEDEEQPRRKGAGASLLIILLIIVAAAAAFWFLAPAHLKARLGLVTGGATPLQLVTTHMDRQHLESGNDLLTLTGRVINPSHKEQPVPPIQAQLKNSSGKVVYSWTIQPPAQTLPAGGSASFNSAEVSVPPGGDELTITLGDARAAGI